MNEAATQTAGIPPGGMRRWAILCGGLLSLAALLIALVVVMHRSKVTNELSLPLLAISGVVALLGALAVVAISFALTNLSDRTQALGLPSGSVRAVIALSLIVLFAILSVYLFSRLYDGGRLGTEDCLTAEELVGVQAGSRPLQVLITRQMPTAEVAVKCAASARAQAAFAADTVAPGVARAAVQDGTKPGDARYTIRYRDTPNPAGEDFAKQLLVLVGTLVTSVASFYFGAKAVSEARDVVSGIVPPPSLVGVAPDKVPVGWEGTLHVMGSNLNQVKEVQIASGSTRITATSVTSNDGRVEAKFAISPDAPTGPWSVRVMDKQGRLGELVAGLTVTKPPSGGAPDGPTGGQEGDAPPMAPEGTGGAPPSSSGTQEAVPAASTTAQPGMQEAHNQASPPGAAPKTAAERRLPPTPGQPGIDGRAPTDIPPPIAARPGAQETHKSALGGKLVDAAVALGDAAGRLKRDVHVQGGLVTVVVGIVLGLSQLSSEDRQSFDAFKSALLREPFDPTLPGSPDAAHERLRREVRVPSFGTAPERDVKLQDLVDEAHALSADPDAANTIENLVRIAPVLAGFSDLDRHSTIERAVRALDAARGQLDRGERPTARGAS